MSALISRQTAGATRSGHIERLDAVAIADQSDVAALGIEDREGEHADEAIHAGFAPFHVGVQDHLGVGAGAEAVPEPQKLLANVSKL